MNTLTRRKLLDRVIAMVLSIAMMFSVLSVKAIGIMADEVDGYVFQVTDENKQPLSGVDVKVSGAETATTDKNGNATVKGLIPEVEYQYVMTKKGFKELKGSFIAAEPWSGEYELSSLEKVTVRGKITNDDGDALVGALIYVSGYTSHETQSDADGYFSVGVYAGQDYDLTVSYPGYNLASKSLELDKENSVVLEKRQSEKLVFSKSEIELVYGESVKNTASSIAGKAESYESSDTSIVEVDNNGVIRAVGVGTATVKAIRNDAQAMVPSVAECTVNVKKARQAALTWENGIPESLRLDDEYENTAKGGSGTEDITYSTDNYRVAAVTKEGKLIILSTGVVTVTAVKPGGQFYEDESISYTIEIKKAAQSKLFFLDMFPDAIYVGDTYDNRAIGGSVEGGKITYYSSDEEVVAVDSNGRITAKSKPGDAVITAVMEGDEYYDSVSASYSITVYGALQEGDIRFAKGAGKKQIAIGEHFSNAVEGAEGKVRYTSSNVGVATVDEKGGVTAYIGGKVVITATLLDGNGKEIKSISYELDVMRKEQVVVFEKGNKALPAITYGDRFSNVARAETPITYISSDPAVATVNSNGELILFKAGTVTIKAVAVEDDRFSETSASYTIQINKADRKVSLAIGTTPTVSYQDNNNRFVNPLIASGDELKGVRFEVTKGKELVKDLDNTNGSFTILGAGQISVRVILPQNECYKEKILTYSLTVGKAFQAICFADSVVTVAKGADFVIPLASVVSPFSSDAPIQYSVKNDPNGVVASINELSGEVILTGKEGEAVILATKPEDENYVLATAVCTLIVSGWEANKRSYEIVGDPILGETGWYTGSISVKARKGYLLSRESSVEDKAWTTELTDIVIADGESEIAFYVKDLETGLISSECKELVRRDSMPPEAHINRVRASGWRRVVEIIYYLLVNRDSIRFDVESSDAMSGVAKVEYYVDSSHSESLSKETLESLGGWTEGTEIAVNRKDADYIYVRVTDVAGNATYVTTRGTIYDAAVPVAELNILSETKLPGYYGNDVNVSIHVEDAAPSSGLASVKYAVVLNGDFDNPSQSGTLFESEDDGLITEWDTDDFVIDSELNQSDDVVLYVYLADKAGNESVAYTDNLHIIREKPTIDILFEDETSEPVESIGQYQGATFYDLPLKTKIEITGRMDLFSEDLPIVSVRKMTDGEDKTEVLKNLEWIHNEPSKDELEGGEKTLGDASHTTYVELEDDAIYIISVNYEDKAGNIAESATETIVISSTLPEGEVVVGGSRWTKLLERLTFNFWRISRVDVKVNVTSNPRMLKSVEYYVADGLDMLTREELEALPLDIWLPYHNALTINRDGNYIVYVKLTDVVGRYSFISSEGIIYDTQKPSLKIEVPESNLFGYYNGDVDVVVTAEKQGRRSGIKEIEYWVVSDGEETQREVIYSIDEDDAKNGQLENIVTASFTVEALKNDSDDVMVFLQATDNAGNISTAFIVNESEEPVESYGLRIAATHPELEVKFNNNTPYTTTTDDETGELGYFKSRAAILSVKERETLHDEESILKGLSISVIDGNSKAIDLTDEDVAITFIGTELGDNPNDTVHLYEIKFLSDGIYDFDVSYINKAGMSAVVSYAAGTVCGRAFVVDATVPTARITIQERIWTRLLEVLTFGIWSNDTFEVSASAEDTTSPVVLEYYVSETDTALDADALDLVEDEEWTVFEKFVIQEDKLFSVYLRVTDYAGNRIYVNSDGHVLDKASAYLAITPETPNEYGVYNHDVSVLIEVNEEEPSSGLKKVEYWISKDGIVSDRETIFSFEYIRDEGENSNGGIMRVYENGSLVAGFIGDAPIKDELRHKFAQTIIIDSEKYNSSNVQLSVRVEDNAGNVTEESVSLDIDVTAPEVTLEFSNNEPNRISLDRGYYPNERTAYLSIRERSNHFDGERAKDFIEISAWDARGNSVFASREVLFGEWVTVEGTTPDDAVHTLPIYFNLDANYEMFIGYKDGDGNKVPGFIDFAWNFSEEPNVGDSVTPYHFTVDRTDPIGSIQVESLGWWDDLVKTLTFGLWSRETVNVSGTSSDATSPVASVSYYKTPNTVAMTRAELELVEGWLPFSSFSVPANEQFAVYLQIIDYAGNTAYISTNGIIVDAIQPIIEQVAPEITIAPAQAVNGIYNTDVPVAVSVVDPMVGDTYSGIKNIRYEVLNMGSVTQSGTLYSFDIPSPTQDQLLRSWNRNDAIEVKSSENNSNDVVIRVYAVDNAGNSNQAQTEIKIDITKPTMSVRYDINEADTAFAGGNTDAFFRTTRIATVTVTERNFDPSRVNAMISNAYGSTPRISGWSTSNGGGNGDSSTHTATITFSDDGAYTFDINCTDMAGNASETTDYSGSLAPQRFTIDKTLPVVSISYDNDVVLNGNYYNNKRIATLRINERNFETSRIVVMASASHNGESMTPPAISGWSSNGTIHTATIEYDKDGLYAFDIAYTDMAGNPAVNFPEQKFYIDMTKPVVTITKIVDESANNDMDNIGFVVTATDANFDICKPTLTAVVREGDDFKTIELDVGTWSTLEDGKIYTVTNLDEDGIYRLTCEVVDKAGNSYSDVILSKADGTPYTVPKEDGEALVTFSVNRNGSTYEIDKKTIELTEKYYVQNAKDDVVIVEINADPLKNYEVTINGRPITEKVDYTVGHSSGEGGWEKYTYTIKKSLLEAEGEYNIVVSSTDKAENSAYSDIKDASVRFVVDRTAPTVAITGLVNDGRYQIDKQVVTLVPMDDGGRLGSLMVYKVDENGTVIETLLRLEGEELLETLEQNDDKVTFELGEGLYQNVRIVCDDMADYEGENNIFFEELITNVSVTANAFLIFWVNKQLRWTVIGAAVSVALAAGTGIGIWNVKKKRKKEDR